MSGAAAVKIGRELKALKDDPVEGVLCDIVDDSNLFEWRIWVEGSKGSPYEDGIFQMQMEFPKDYPMSPPKLKMLSEFWHPNIYKNGEVCISILHPPVDDPMSGERPEERWMPTQTVSTIMLSVLSMLNDPNVNSPANVDASVEWRDRRAQFIEHCKKLVEKAKQEVPADVRDKIPHPDTDPKQREKRIQKLKLLNAPMTTLEDEEYGYDDNDDNMDFDYDDVPYDDDVMEAEGTGDGSREDQED